MNSPAIDRSLWSWRRSLVFVLVASVVFWGIVMFALLRL
jgi:hypothetical protein